MRNIRWKRDKTEENGIMVGKMNMPAFIVTLVANAKQKIVQKKEIM